MKIMAPAGDVERLRAAIKAGADEVYMGLKGYGARRFAGNFTPEEYIAAIDEAHRAGVDVHLTFNTVMSDAELETVYPDMKRLYEAGLDEAIVQDFGVAAWFREFFPDLPLCASTQLSPGMVSELNWYKEQGFRRAVLARELTLDEIRTLKAGSDIELEVFISGALCLGASGKCCLSSFVGGRSGNRGMCAQPCRQYYRAEVPGAGDDAAGAEYGYFLSLKDQLQGREEIKALIDAGIESAKIEGRMKSPQYVYTTTRYYRDLVDSITGVSSSASARRLAVKKNASAPKNGAGSDDDTRRFQIASLFSRGYARGYFHERDPQMINEFYASNFGVEVGRVRRDAVKLSRPLRNGDGVVFLDETARKLGGLNVSGIRLVDPTNPRRTTVVESAAPGDLVRFHEPVPEGAALLYRTFDYVLNKEIETALAQTRRHEPVDAKLVARIGRPLQLVLSTPRAKAFVESDQPLAQAQKKGADSASLREALDRFGETPFYLAGFRPEFDADVFVPKSLLNQLRQECAAQLEEKILESYRKTAPERPESAQVATDLADRPQSFRDARDEYERIGGVYSSKLREPDPEIIAKLAATVRTRAQYDACRAFGVKKIYSPTSPVQYESRARFQTSPDFAPIAGTVAEALRLEERGVPYALDWYFNATNARAVKFLADSFPNAKTIYVSPEISDRAVDELARALAPFLAERGITLATPVYGRLLAMHTEKTLFETPRMKLVGSDDRRFLVEKNAAVAEDAPEEWRATVEGPGAAAAPTGSSLYLNDALDLLDAVPWILRSGIGELRLDFTSEKYAETTRALERAASGGTGKFHTFSYGYTRDGVF